MKVFNGEEFLASRGCEINLSNGMKYIVKDLSDSTLEALTSISEDTPFNEVRNVVIQALQAKVEDIEDVGMVELQGALSFLSESLFNIESQNEKIND